MERYDKKMTTKQDKERHNMKMDRLIALGFFKDRSNNSNDYDHDNINDNDNDNWNDNDTSWVRLETAAGRTPNSLSLAPRCRSPWQWNSGRGRSLMLLLSRWSTLIYDIYNI